MKELIEEINLEISRLKNHDWFGVDYQKGLFRKAITALESAEAEKQQLSDLFHEWKDRAEHYMCANDNIMTGWKADVARREAREAELRAEVERLRGMVPECKCTLGTVPHCEGFVFPHPNGIHDACGRVIREAGQLQAMFCGHSKACHHAAPKEEV